MPQPDNDVDPFDLPEWLGTSDVVWSSTTGLASGHLIEGRLTSTAGEELGCDLLAVDQAYPAPVAADSVRLRAHQAWQHGQVLLITRAARLTLAVPGATWAPEEVLTAVARLARAVGARPERFSVLLRVGG